MSKPSAPAADDASRAAYYQLKAHVIGYQDAAFELEALLQGATILQDADGGSNALRVVLDVALEKAGAIYSGLDSVNLPKIAARGVSDD